MIPGWSCPRSFPDRSRRTGRGHGMDGIGAAAGSGKPGQLAPVRFVRIRRQQRLPDSHSVKFQQYDRYPLPTCGRY